jgi:hypothetical protein
LGGQLLLTTTHDRRHLWQAEQVRNDPAFPGVNQDHGQRA